MSLTPESIVAASLEILGEYGLADLTMRRVASVLDVKAGALYWHFPNKQSLLAAVADEILSALGVPDDADLGQWLAAWAAGYRELLLSHRDAAELVSSALALGLGNVDPCASGRGRLEDSGMGAEDADAVMQAFNHFVLGHTMEEQTRAQLVVLGVLEEIDEDKGQRQFTAGVDLLVSGTSTRMA